jgi:hypothetical protein
LAHLLTGILKKRKIREIVVTVRDDVRVNEEQADELFHVLKEAIEEDENLQVNPWHRAGELGKRQMVWMHEYEDGKFFRFSGLLASLLRLILSFRREKIRETDCRGCRKSLEIVPSWPKS